MMQRLKKPVIIGAIVIVALIGGYTYLSSTRKPVNDFVVAKRGTVVQEVSVTGNTKPVQDVDLAFEKAGKVAWVNIAVGDRAVAGQTLVVLDQAELSAGLLQAQANVQAQQAKLDELKRGTRPEEIRVDEVKVASAETTLEEKEKGLIDAIEDAYTKSDDAVRNKVDQFFSNPQSANPYLNLQPVDPALKNRLEGNRAAIEQMLVNWKSATNVFHLGGGTPADNLATYLSTAKQNVAKVRSFLDDAATAVNSLVATTNISQTTIDSYKSAVSTARTNVNTADTNLSTGEEEWRTAQSDLAVSQNELSLAQAGTVPEQIAAQEAQVKQYQAAVAATQAQLAKTVLRAPIAGTVTRQDAKAGEIVPANTVIVSLISASNFEIEANVPEADIAKVKPGEPAKVTLDAYGNEVVFDAAVSKIDPGETVVEGVATYKTTLQFIKADERIRPGMTANIDILTDKRENVIVVPQRAVTAKDGDRSVLVDTGKPQPEERKVKAGLRGSDGNVEILEGIQEGDKVITFVKAK